MRSAQIAARCCNASVSNRQHLDHLIRLERVTNTDPPILSLTVPAANLNIAARINIIVLEAPLSQHLGGVVDRPAFDDAGRIDQAVMLDVEESIRLLSGL